ncbi:FtsK/SpoIIIE domain-containing protein [Streptomyces sp. KM77-8]|uniref:FtsK/SpoIIIE domain-containing protein n=1 Tax=Streptomyces haneummycinicus TaxID=3074435 RepID=A0AAT9H9B8_9ACTN
MADAVRVLLPVLLVLVVLLVVRRRMPVVFWWLVGYPAVALRVLVSYRATMDACGLTVPASAVRRATARMIGRQAAPVPPRHSFPRPTGSGLVMRLRMAAGQAPEDFAASADRLRHAWGAHAVHVRPTKPGRLELRLVGWDVLAEVRPARHRLGDGPLCLPLALREDGVWHVRDFRTVPHELILGATQSGKSVYLRNLLCGLARQPVVLVGIDCKWGVELAPFAPRLSALADTPDRANELLDVLLEEMEARFRLIGLRSGAGPDAVLTSDVWGFRKRCGRCRSWSSSTRSPNSSWPRARTTRSGGRDGHQAHPPRPARPCGRHLPGGVRAALRRRTGQGRHDAARSALGPHLPPRQRRSVGEHGARRHLPEAALAATAIPAERPGVAVVGDSSGGWSRVRSPHLTLDDAAAVCRDTAALVPELPRLDAFRPTVAVEAAGPSSSTAAVPTARPVTE